MLKWLSRVTKKNKVINEYKRNSIEVVQIIEKIRENKLRWLWNVLWREKTETAKVIKKINVKYRRGRERLKNK